MRVGVVVGMDQTGDFPIQALLDTVPNIVEQVGEGRPGLTSLTNVTGGETNWGKGWMDQMFLTINSKLVLSGVIGLH